MHWVVGTWVITSLLGLGKGHNTLFEGYDRTLSGYHLCNTTELVSETHVISYPTSYTQRRPCGGWLPWAMCDVTVYKTEYRTEVYYMPKQVQKCCPGYEQFGSYCALTLNRSPEFTSKPGLCPTAGEAGSQQNHSNSSGSVCNWDIDCPQRQKCCQTENSNISYCSDPAPPATRTWCFNVTVTVKTTYQLLTTVNGLFNHTRLLHSVVTGALGNEDIAVHHVLSWSAGLFTTSSSLLVCSSKVLSFEDISAKLYQLGNTEEVTDVVVQDVNECTDPELNNCSPHAYCMNTEGSYECGCYQGYHDHNPSRPGSVCTAPSATTQPVTDTTPPPWVTHPLPSNKTNTDEGPLTTSFTSGPFWTSTSVPTSHSSSLPSSQPSSTCGIPVITSLLSSNVTAFSFRVSWTTNTQTGVTFHLVLQNGSTQLNMSDLSLFNKTFTDLNPAVLYTVRVTPSACGIQGNPVEIKVRTDGQSLRATARLTNVAYTETLSDPNSDAYMAFCNSVINEILSSLPQDIRLLVQSRQVITQISSLSSGSIIVNFSIIFPTGNNLNMLNISSALMESLQNSTIYVVDSSSIHIEDLNECLLAEADCSPWANCENTFGSYICACWSGYTDLSPSRPGRSCAASPNATTSTVHPTTNYVSTDTTTTTSTTSGNPSTRVQSNTTTTVSSTSTTPASTRLTDTTANITGPLLSYVAVECSLGYISIIIRRDVLLANNIPESSLYLGTPECVLSGTNATHVWLTAAWDKCGTTIDRNSTHNLVNVTLYNDMSSFVMPSYVRLEVPVICTYPSRIIISTGYAPTGLYDMIKEPLAGSGSFQVIVRLLNGTHPLPENYIISPDEEIVVEVGVNTSISQIKVVINKCWVTSSIDSSQLPSYVFLEDGCPVPNTYTTVLQNGNDTVSLVSVKIFSFVNLDIIYLHCQIQICVEIQDNTCRPSCIMERTYRSSNLLGVTRASVGPLNRLRPASLSNESSNTLQTVGFVLLGVGVFLFAVVAAGLLYYKRKIGNYNFRFRPQQENFTYHVFGS